MKATVEFLTNMATAWVVAGMITPFFSQTQINAEVAVKSLSGIIVGLVFLSFAIKIEKVNNEK